MSAILNGKQIKAGSLPVTAIKTTDKVTDADGVIADNNAKLVTVQAAIAYVASQVATVNTLTELSDTIIEDLADGHGLIWHQASNAWINADLSTTYVTQTALDTALATVDITEPVLAASTVPVAITTVVDPVPVGLAVGDKYITATGNTFDGIDLTNENFDDARVLFAGQGSAIQNGIYVMDPVFDLNGDESVFVRKITRATDADIGAELPAGKTVLVLGFNIAQNNNLKTFILSSAVTTVGTSAQSWVKPRDIDLSAMTLLQSVNTNSADRLLIWDESENVNKAITTQSLATSFIDDEDSTWGLGIDANFGHAQFFVHRNETEVNTIVITNYQKHNGAFIVADDDIGSLNGFNTGINVGIAYAGTIKTSVQVFVNGILATESQPGGTVEDVLSGDYFWSVDIAANNTDNPNGNAFVYEQDINGDNTSTQVNNALAEGFSRKVGGNYVSAELTNEDVLFWNGSKYSLSHGDIITIVYQKN